MQGEYSVSMIFLERLFHSKAASKEATLDESVFLVVKSVIDELDIYSLLKGEAPSDEFDIESKEISSRILNISTPEQIASVIAEVFNKYFDLHSQPSEYIKPATRIKELLQPKKVGGSSDGEDTVS